ncbi:hypothetical protein [Clostridium kluyveri]|uniref:hypothetical protein n=1 Tax=Clostridium kluyveri TaxID=1534 RepID=UPI003A4C6428
MIEQDLIEQKETYFGLKLYALVSMKGFITNFIITTANVDDRAAVFELVEANKHIKNTRR